MRHGAHVARQRIVVRECPVGMQVLGIDEIALAQRPHGPFHGIEGINLAGEDAEFQQLVKGLGKWRGVALRWHPEHLAVRHQRVNGQAVLRQRARVP